MKQLALGFVQYSQDYDERLVSTASDQASWRIRIFPYVRSAQVYFCPSGASVSAANAFTGTEAVLPAERLKVASYGVPIVARNASWPLAGNSLVQTISSVPTPTEVILVGDTNQNPTWDGEMKPYIGLAANNTTNTTRYPPHATLGLNDAAYRHLEGANYAYLDGHVKWRMLESIQSECPQPPYDAGNDWRWRLGQIHNATTKCGWIVH